MYKRWKEWSMESAAAGAVGLVDNRLLMELWVRCGQAVGSFAVHGLSMPYP